MRINANIIMPSNDTSLSSLLICIGMYHTIGTIGRIKIHFPAEKYDFECYSLLRILCVKYHFTHENQCVKFEFYAYCIKKDFQSIERDDIKRLFRYCIDIAEVGRTDSADGAAMNQARM